MSASSGVLWDGTFGCSTLSESQLNELETRLQRLRTEAMGSIDAKLEHASRKLLDDVRHPVTADVPVIPDGLPRVAVRTTTPALQSSQEGDPVREGLSGDESMASSFRRDLATSYQTLSFRYIIALLAVALLLIGL